MGGRRTLSPCRDREKMVGEEELEEGDGLGEGGGGAVGEESARWRWLFMWGRSPEPEGKLPKLGRAVRTPLPLPCHLDLLAILPGSLNLSLSLGQCGG